MIIPIILLCVGVAAAVFFFRRFSMDKIATISELTKQRQSVEAKYNFLLRRKMDLAAELAKKEKRLTTLLNNQQGMRIKTAAEMDISEESEDERVSNLLLSMGKISLEDNEKIKKKKTLLKMDFLTTALALGFIDGELSKKIKKDQIRPK